jgi:hypothetical protein
MKTVKTDERKTTVRNTKRVAKPDYTGFEFISAMAVTLLLILVSIFSIAGKDREYSENENRNLAQKPVVTLSSLMDGKFMEDIETYLSDQFVMRDALVSIRTDLDVFIGKREINGVYIGKKHFLFEKPSAYNEDRIKKTTDAMNVISAQNGEIRSYVAIVPNSSEILSDYMPSNAPSQNQLEQVGKVYSSLNGYTCIDLFTPLKNAEDPASLYYKTDHHWTSEAVEIAYRKIATDMGLDANAYQYKDLAVTNSFQGTLASSSGIFSAKDTIRIPTCPENIMYRVTYVDEGRTCNTVFDQSKLLEKSKYDVFFGGNFSQIMIETNSESDRVLMVVKDSYANSLIPLLIPHFKTIIVVDPRYYTGNVQEIIEREEVTDILWLYNVNTFLTDTSIYGKFT